MSFSSIVKPPANDGKNFELLILHNNDMHARFEQTSQLSGACTTLDREAGKCYGGFPRVATVVKEARRKAESGEGPPVLYLNAGDTYTGTAWFTIYKWKVAAEFLNALQPDAVSLGNNELDKGSTNLSPFLENLNSPVLACNVIVNSMETKQKIQKSIVKDINGVKVGIVGYLKLDSDILDSTGYIEYIDEVIALKEEATKLKTEGVEIIIALGHSTPEKDIEIATEVENIDLIISGHRNMFYSNGSNAEIELERILKPVMITQKSGKKLPILQSFTYDKYLGKVHAVFDSDGNLKLLQSNPILLDKTIQQSVDMSDIIKKYTEEQMTSLATIIGDTVVVIDGSNCKKEECNLGNLITDSMMFYYATRYEGEHWTDAPIAIINGGSLSGTLSPLIRPFPIRRSDLINFLPGPSNLVTITMSGTLLKQMLEESVANYTLNNTSEQFLQFSGIRVIYDISKDPGSRVISAVIRCGDCDIPEFIELQEERLYKIIIPSILASGNNGYSMLGNLTKESLNYDAVATLTEFIQMRSPVYPEIADRIILLNVPEHNEPDSAASTKISLAILIYTIFTIAVSLGNHEFDNGISGLTPFITNLTCPVLAANIILDKVPELKKEENLLTSVIFNISNVKVGVIGYLTPDTKFLAIKNDVEYIDEVAAIRREVKNLKTQGVNILIALGHSGFTKDKEIAYAVDGIDLVIGGHTNTFLWNGLTSDMEIPEGPYPMYVKQASGKLVPVMQAYAYTKYLGKLLLTFNSDGEIVNVTGNPILLNNSIQQDPDVLAIVKRYQDEVNVISETIAGNSSVYLDGLSCRISECNMGNLITDAIVNKYAREYTGSGWTDSPIAILQGGGIRSSIIHDGQRFNISVGDLYAVMPYDSSIVKISINGSNIVKMLEHAVASFGPSRGSARLLQMSGMRVVYDLSKPPGKRVKHIEILCGKCDIPIYSNISLKENYNILVNSFLSMGGDGYTVFKDLPSTPLPYNEFQCTFEYLKKMSPVHPSIENRIIMANSLGNHELDEGVSGLTPFIENLTCPVLAANLILNKVPELEKESNLRKSIVLNKSGVSIGLIGYLTPDTKVLAVKNDVEYIEEVEALQEEVQKLKKEGINIIIGLGHSGYLKDLEIAKKVDGLDLIIGGHTNTFLWNGTVPDSEKALGPYPTYVVQASGKLVPVVQAYAYTKYLGKLHMVFNSKGELLSADGRPILLDNTIPQDPEVLSIVDKYKDKILNYTEEIIGNTSVLLDGLSCQHKECNMGNLIADAMIYRYVSDYEGRKQWSDVPIAIIQGGGIRSSIDHADFPAPVTKGDLIAVLPFEGILVVVTMSGKILLQMLEHSVENLTQLDYPGEFLQVSGIQVEYDMSKPSGSRVAKANVRCWNCSIPIYSSVVDTEMYNVIMPNFLSNGGDGYNMLEGLPKRALNYSELTSTLYYIQNHSPILPASLGNHEFDEEVDGVVPFIANLSCPVLAANLILDDVPILKEQSNLYKSVVLTKNGVEIGIIGYLTPDTSFLAPKNDVKYEEEIYAIRKESLRLRRLGVQIIIALGHSGFVKDLEIAKQVEDLDLVIGGHSNTFLTNTNTSEIPEYSEGPYPTLVRQKSGRTVLVVQAYAFTKYLGRLHLVFNAQGEIIHFDGNPILLNNNFKQDPIILEMVNRYKLEFNEINSEVVGSSMVFLDGVSCRIKECNLGNFFTDAVVYYAKQHDTVHSDVNIAVIPGGRIRTSISNNVKPFNITKGDLITVIPFSDSLCIITMNGTILKEALEHSVASWRLLDAPGQFLQMSGMDVTYDLAKKVGSRVIRARAICSNCKEPQIIKEDYEYKIITSTFLADGGDNYTMFENLPRDVMPYNEVESALYYLSKYSPINAVVSNRIVILNDNKLNSIPFSNEDKDKTAQLPSTGHHNKTHTAMFFLLLIMNLSLIGRR
ncbi:unnamed protein product [Danaus chrysippus]|uniref:(African queen) hypothetical protein n=1 Tax=Danaus chrysippus TaxID=151541 RepID=A0A8J2QMN5_9NEOP|nr:unnamed protein product [Danaus chrysippus]